VEELQGEGAVKGQSRVQSAHVTRNVYSQLSGLEDVVINDYMVMDKSRQVLHSFLTL
jgi:hypothetical protein